VLVGTISPVSVESERPYPMFMKRLVRFPSNIKCKICGAFHGGLHGSVCPDCYSKGYR